MRKKTVGERIRELREGKGITLAEFAKTLGIQKSAMSYIENDIRSPKADLLVKICDYFSVPADYILGQSEAKTKDIGIREICDKTGLSETAVNTLMEYAKEKTVSIHPASPYKADIFDAINFLVEQEYLFDIAYDILKYAYACTDMALYWENIYNELSAYEDKDEYIQMLSNTPSYCADMRKLHDEKDLSKYHCENSFRDIITDAANYLMVEPPKDEIYLDKDLYRSLYNAIQNGGNLDADKEKTLDEIREKLLFSVNLTRWAKLIFNLRQEEGVLDGDDSEKE